MINRTQFIVIIVVLLAGCSTHVNSPETTETAASPTTTDLPGGSGIVVAEFVNGTPSHTPTRYTNKAIQNNKYILKAIGQLANKSRGGTVIINVPEEDVGSVKETLAKTGQYVRYQDLVIRIKLLIEV